MGKSWRIGDLVGIDDSVQYMILENSLDRAGIIGTDLGGVEKLGEGFVRRSQDGDVLCRSQLGKKTGIQADQGCQV